MKIYIESYGCNRRKLDVAKFHNYFAVNGYQIVSKPEKADYILVTTCAFKKEEENHSLSIVSNLKRYKAKILIYGCLPDISPAKYAQACSYDYISPKNINEIDRYFENIRYKFSEVKESNLIPGHIDHVSFSKALIKLKRDFSFSPEFFSQLTTYLGNKIRGDKQDYYLFTSRGCLGGCTYCAIKRSIGPVKSKPIGAIVDEFKAGINAGYNDFILLGDDVGAYGQDINAGFPYLISNLLTEAENVGEIGHGSAKNNGKIGFLIQELHPNWLVLFREELVRPLSSERIKYLLCPLQSGNNRILQLMKRGHDAEAAFAAIKEIRSLNPGIMLTTQIIVGFPSETEEEFYDTLRLLENLRFDEVIIFPYDEKENTEAAEIYPKVPNDVICKRVKESLQYLRKRKIRAFLSCR